MIRRIRIQNFKSLRDVTVELGDVTVLIGKSGSGKSNFVEAIRTLRDCLKGENPFNGIAAQRARCGTNPAGELSFDVEFDIPGSDAEFHYQLQFAGHLTNQRVARESLRTNGRVIYAQGVDRQKETQWIHPPPLLAPPLPGTIALQRLPGIEESTLALTHLTVGIGVYSFPLEVLGGPSGTAPVRNGDIGLDDSARTYLATMKDVAASLDKFTVRRGILAALRSINPTISSVDLDSIQAPTKAVVGHVVEGKSNTIVALDLDQESSGFRRFYAHLLALYQTPPKQTLIFEEPENGIYPDALAILAEEFQSAPREGRGQVILTTHNPVLLDHFSDDQVRVVELVDLETRIGMLSPEQRQSIQEAVLHTGELLTVDPARRESAPDEELISP